MEPLGAHLLSDDLLLLSTHHLIGLDEISLASPGVNVSSLQLNRFLSEDEAVEQFLSSQYENTESHETNDFADIERSNLDRQNARSPLTARPISQPLLNTSNHDALISPVSTTAIRPISTQHPNNASSAIKNRVRVIGQNERIVGTPDDDRIDASEGRGHNQLFGKRGHDRILVKKNDIAKGQGGNDYLDARQGKAHNLLEGGVGNDTLVARKRDRLFGNGGNDVLDSRRSKARNFLNGGGGNDRLYAGRKRDNLTGGGGADEFWLATQQLPLKPHIVNDFEPGVDRLGIENVNGINEASALTLTSSGTDTTVRFQGQAIALLQNITPLQLHGDDIIVISSETEPPSNPSNPEPPTSPPIPDNPNPGPSDESGNPAIFATYRKDYFFPNEVYNEDTPEPLTGGRIQIAAIAQASGRVNNVFIDGIERRVIYEENPTTLPPFEWVHVWPQQAKAGEPIWVNFHSRDAKWDSLTSAPIRVETRNGPAIDGKFAINETPAPLTYVTTTDEYSRILIHVQNMDTVAHRVEHLWVNGVDVLAENSERIGTSILPNRQLAAESHALLEIPLAQPTEPGDAWTVVVEYENAPAAVGTGRIIPEFFPVMAWNNTSERPFPSGELDNYLSIRNAGIDTIFVNDGTCAGGECDPYTLINEELANLDGFGAFVNYSPFIGLGQNFPDFTDTSGIVAVMTGDESDDTIYDDDTGIPIPAIKALDSRRSWLRYPELPTFNGGKTNKHIGSFAGMTDIQGIDFYTAAGAPHITAFGQHPPLRATFDYLRNTRNNHMPLTTWMYTQGLSPAWNRDPILGGDEFSAQPDPQEILAQGMMAIAAGAKGLAWFQVNQKEAEKAPERWQAITDVNSMVQAVRPWLREGDVTGEATSDAETLVEMIHAPDALVVPIISLDTVSEPTDLGFLLAQSEEDLPRWIFDESTPDVAVTIPPGFNVSDVFEVQPGGIADINVNLSGETALFEDIPLDNDMPVRLLVLATDNTVRTEINSTFNSEVLVQN